MQVVVCDDELLEQRVAVLETLCGFRTHPSVLAACVRVQSVARGYLLRKDKAAFDQSLSIVVRAAQRYLRAARAARRTAAATRLQARVRGVRQRSTPVGRAVRRLSEERRSVERLELCVLRLTSNYSKPFTNLPTHASRRLPRTPPE